MSTFSLFDFPDDLILMIMIEWLDDLRDITFLDSAVCHRKHRETLLRILRSTSCVFTGNQFVDLDLDWLMSRNVGLRNLEFSPITEEWDIANFMKKSTKLDSIESIDLSSLENLKESTFVWTILENCIKLQSLDISSSSSIPDFVFPGSSSNSSSNSSSTSSSNTYTQYSLKALHFSHCSLKDSGLDKISLHLQQLEVLDLYACSNITDKGLKNVSNRCPRLSVLELAYCYNLTDVGMQTLAIGCTHITTLDVSHCDGLSNTGFIHIAENLIQLKSLKLRECKALTTSGVIAIVQHLHALVRL